MYLNHLQPIIFVHLVVFIILCAIFVDILVLLLAVSRKT